MRASSDFRFMIDLTIIIVSWNCRKDLVACLHSIGSSKPDCQYPIVVVDNGSTDGTREEVQRTFPSVTLVANPRNLGFAAANNQALALSRSHYVMLLNPDTILRQGAVDVLIRFMDENPTAWVVGPLLLNDDGSVQRTGVRFPSLLNLFFETFFLDRLFSRSRLFGRHNETYADRSAPHSVDYVQGACMVIRSSALETVGNLDEQFFMYFEEVDFCFRVAAAGGKVYVCPTSEVVHVGGDVFGHYDERRLEYYHRSLLRFYRKHLSRVQEVLVRLVLLMRSSIRVVVWWIVAISKPTARIAAMSCVRGYCRAIVVMVRPRLE